MAEALAAGKSLLLTVELDMNKRSFYIILYIILYYIVIFIFYVISYLVY